MLSLESVFSGSLLEWVNAVAIFLQLFPHFSFSHLEAMTFWLFCAGPHADTAGGSWLLRLHLLYKQLLLTPSEEDAVGR